MLSRAWPGLASLPHARSTCWCRTSGRATTERLDDLVVEFASDHGAIPAPLNYRGFPKAICTSVNHVVCHGIPNAKPLKEGDIVNIDVTLILDGWHGDTSRMYAVGPSRGAPSG